jgi:hypothetical protein
LLIQEPLAEFAERGSGVEHVVDSDQDLVGNRQGCAPSPTSGLQPVIFVLVVAASLSCRVDRRRHQSCLEVNIAGAGLVPLLHSGALVVAWANTSPGGKSGGVAEHRHVNADLCDDRGGGAVVDARNTAQQRPLRRKGLGALLDARLQRGNVGFDSCEGSVRSRASWVRDWWPARPRR